VLEIDDTLRGSDFEDKKLTFPSQFNLEKAQCVLADQVIPQWLRRGGVNSEIGPKLFKEKEENLRDLCYFN